MITRRELLLGATSVAGLQVLNPLTSLAQENSARPFLYTLDDYVNPTKPLAEMGKLYLDELQEPTILVTWATWCRPCVDKIPEYNQLYQRYGEKVRFLSALLEHNIDAKPESIPPLPPSEYLALCMHNSLVSKYELGSKEYEQAIGQLKENRITSTELAEMARVCEEDTREAYDLSSSKPKERQALTYAKERLQQRGKWPLFPTYVLDDKDTLQYLGGKTAFFVTLFRKGRIIKKLEGRAERRIERELAKL